MFSYIKPSSIQMFSYIKLKKKKKFPKPKTECLHWKNPTKSHWVEALKLAEPHRVHPTFVMNWIYSLVFWIEKKKAYLWFFFFLLVYIAHFFPMFQNVKSVLFYSIYFYNCFKNVHAVNYHTPVLCVFYDRSVIIRLWRLCELLL